MTTQNGVAVFFEKCFRLALFVLGFLALFDADEALSA